MGSMLGGFDEKMGLADKEKPKKQCSGCYVGFSGPWCDNCDQWPCVCVDDEENDDD